MARARAHPSPLVRVLSPLVDFLRLEAASALLIPAAAIVALFWANSPWSGSYEDLWNSRVGLTVAGHTLDLQVREWLNDGLMTVFFLVVGLEIKRELVDGGHLSSVRHATLPATAALGGMIIPALTYLAIAGSTAPRGWAIPMATDIALAVGVLAVAGSRLPPSLRAFLLGLAIVDDIGAILVIAAVYSRDTHLQWLIGAGLSLAGVVVLRLLGVNRTWTYVVLGAGAWYSLHEAGIHPTLAGVALGLLAPSTPRLDVDLIDERELLDLSDADAARTTSELARGSVSVVEWLQHVLHPWTSYVIIPLFALANSGIELSADGLSDAARSRITWGVLAGLLLGKPIGVVLATTIAARSGVTDPPSGSTPGQLAGIGAAAGIGFTVALFVTELAFDDAQQQSDAKIGILVGSALAALAAAIVLRRSTRGDRRELQVQ